MPSEHAPNATVAVFSSYDLSNSGDGASLHLAATLKDAQQVIATKAPRMRDLQATGLLARLANRTSFGFSLLQACKMMFGAAPRQKAILLGMHSLLLARFFRSPVYVPLDCWSDREEGLAARAGGLSGVKRRLYARLVKACEARLLRYCSVVAVVSPEEAQKYQSRHPDLRAALLVLPRMDFLATAGAKWQQKPLTKGAPVTIWMDTQTGYGRSSVLASLDHFARLARENPEDDFDISILSRSPDFAPGPGQRARNLPFVPELDQFLAGQSLLVLPDQFGSGVKNRALLAAALGVPILATPVALEGLGWEPTADHALIWNDYPAFRSAILAAKSGTGASCAARLSDRIAQQEAERLTLQRAFQQRMQDYARPQVPAPKTQMRD